MKNIRKERAALYVLPIAILAISTAAIFIRYAQRTIPSITIAAYRLMLASLFLLPFTIKKAFVELQGLSVKSMALILFSGLLLAAHFTSWIISLDFTNILSSVVLVTTTPIWVSVISPLFIKEQISQRFWVGLAVAFTGILIVSSVGLFGGILGDFQNGAADFSRDRLLGNGLAILGAFSAAGYVIIGRKLRRSISTGTYTFSVYSCAAIFLVCFSLFITKDSFSVSIADLKWLVLLALIPQLIGHTLINWFLGFIPAHKVSISLLGEPIGSTLLAIIFLQELPTVQEIVGAIVILSGIFFAIVGKPETNPNPE